MPTDRVRVRPARDVVPDRQLRGDDRRILRRRRPDADGSRLRPSLERRWPPTRRVWVFVVDQLITHYPRSGALVAEAVQSPTPRQERDAGVEVASSRQRSSATRAIASVRVPPKHSSWLNQIEMVFGVIMRKVIPRRSFTSVSHLRSKLFHFIAYFNLVFAKPFRCTYTGLPLISSSYRASTLSSFFPRWPPRGPSRARPQTRTFAPSIAPARSSTRPASSPPSSPSDALIP